MHRLRRLAVTFMHDHRIRRHDIRRFEMAAIPSELRGFQTGYFVTIGELAKPATTLVRSIDLEIPAHDTALSGQS